MTYPLLAQDVVALCEALGAERPMVCGFSDGGTIATVLGIMHPTFARAIVNDAGFDLFDPESPSMPMFRSIFGGHPDEASRAQQVAAAIGQQLNCASPTLFPKSSFGPGKTASRADVASGREITGVVRPFWNGRLPYGKAQLEIYVFTTQKQDKKQ